MCETRRRSAAVADGANAADAIGVANTSKIVSASHHDASAPRRGANLRQPRVA
jgi:hypothetical protein